MPLPVFQFVLRAKQLEIEGLQRMAARIELVDLIGRLIDALQRERGASSLYVASGGMRFGQERQDATAQAEPLEATLRQRFMEQLDPAQGSSARMLSLIAWVLLDLDTLAGLRQRIGQRGISAHDAVAAFSRVIAGMVELIFHLADVALQPGISRLLVALVHVVQGKELAGQERAVGAQLFASGQCSADPQQRILHLIDAQERSLQVFEDFAEPSQLAWWQRHQLQPHVAALERLRRALCTAKPGAALDGQLSENWFEASSERIAGLWQVEVGQAQALRQACEAQIQASEQELQDSEGLLRQLRDNPPPHTHAVACFFEEAAQVEAVPVLPGVADGPASAVPGGADQPTVAALKTLLQAQSSRLARVEVELDTARRALHERKVIERAKRALMSRLGMSEEDAFRALQKASMDHNRRLVDVAEATLAMPELAAPASGRARPPHRS